MNKNNSLVITEYSFNDIKPLNLKNEKELLSSLDVILQNTTDIVIDWKKREASIKRLGGIILGNYGHHQSFIKYFNQKLYLNLSIQMADLRSSLMKEACRITVLAGKELGSLIEPAVEKMLTQYVLYKLSGSANRVISETSANCIYHLVKYVQSNKIIGRVCEQTSSKGNAIRLRCGQTLMLICGEYPSSLINKNMQILEDSMRALMGDPNGDVRASARRAFLVYKSRFENQAGIFFNLLDKNIQKAIIDDEASGVTPYTTIAPEINTNDIIEEESNEKPKSPIYKHQFKKSPKKSALNNSQGSYQTSTSASFNHLKISSYSNEDPNSEKASPMSNNSANFKSMNSYDSTKLSQTETKKKILKNLNSRLDELTLLTGGQAKTTELPKESLESQINRYISKIENSEIMQDKIFGFEFFYNNFSKMYSEISTISKTSLKRMIEIHIENLTESNKNLIIQIMKNLIKFFFYLNTLFNEFEINQITKLLITHLSSRDPQVEKTCNQLLEIIRKKTLNSILFQAIFELLNDKDCDEEVAYEVLDTLLDNSNDLLSNPKFFKPFFTVLCQGEASNRALGSFLDKLYKKYKDLFIDTFNEEKPNNQKLLLMILETNHSFFLRDLKYQFEDNDNESNPQSNIVPKVSDTVKKNAPICTSYQMPVPKEVSSAIVSKNINQFIRYISSNKSYIPQFLLLLSNQSYSTHSNTIITFIYALLSSPVYAIDLNAAMTLLIKQLTDSLVKNSTDSNVVDSIKEIFNLIPFKLNAQNYFTIISKYLTTGNDILLLQVLLLSIKNFVINNKEQNLGILLPYFIESVFSMLNHQSSDIRKHAVYCAVEVYLVLGYKFEPYLNELTQSQQNLIRLFIKKKTGN